MISFYLVHPEQGRKKQITVFNFEHSRNYFRRHLFCECSELPHFPFRTDTNSKLLWSVVCRLLVRGCGNPRAWHGQRSFSYRHGFLIVNFGGKNKSGKQHFNTTIAIAKSFS